MCLTRLLYFSENTMEGSGGAALAHLREIQSTSVRNNRAVDLTGALVFDSFWFLQALEGDRADVWTTLKRIEEDQRHTNVVIVEARQVESRLFANWWMGLVTLNELTAPIFAPYQRNGMLRPADMTADEVLKLMTTLCDFGHSRKLAAVA